MGVRGQSLCLPSPFFLNAGIFSKAPQVILTCIPGMWILGPIRSPPHTEEKRETQGG